jgi:hypothetical protein
VSASAEIGSASASRCVDASAVSRTQPDLPHYQNLLRLDAFSVICKESESFPFSF